MFRTIAYLAAAVLTLLNSAYINRIEKFDFLQPAASVSSPECELSESDALEVIRNYINVFDMAQKGFTLKALGRRQDGDEDYYFFMYSSPTPEEGRNSGAQGYTISTMPVFDLEYLFKVNAKTGNVEHSTIHRR